MPQGKAAMAGLLGQNGTRLLSGNPAWRTHPKVGASRSKGMTAQRQPNAAAGPFSSFKPSTCRIQTLNLSESITHLAARRSKRPSPCSPRSPPNSLQQHIRTGSSTSSGSSDGCGTMYATTENFTRVTTTAKDTTRPWLSDNLAPARQTYSPCTTQKQAL